MIAIAFCAGCRDRPENRDPPRSEHRRRAGEIVRETAEMSAIVPPTSEVEQVATGFTFVEGPVWVVRDGEAHLAFSDLRANALHRWYPDGRLETADAPLFRGRGGPNPGPNGITVDAEARLVICDTGNRRIVRQERDRTFTTLAERYRGQRLNSPNDLVYHSDGSLYFTDPPHGLRGGDRSPQKELAWNGVYRLRADGTVDLLATDLPRPNGIAFAPDERVLYVSNTGPDPIVVAAYDVRDDGTLGSRAVLYDLKAAGGADGVKVDRAGRLYVATPKGIAIITADGRLVGTIRPDESPSNLAWAEDGSVLYITARSSVYRLRLSVPGVPPRLGPGKTAGGRRSSGPDRAMVRHRSQFGSRRHASAPPYTERLQRRSPYEHVSDARLPERHHGLR